VNCRGSPYPYRAIAILAILFAPPVAQSVEHDADGMANGIWRSVGYGRLLQVGDGNARLWQFGAADCRPLGPALPVADVLVRPRIQSSGRRLRTGMVGQLTIFTYERLQSLPAHCVQRPELDADPVRNFDALWHVFDEHYGFFHEHAVPWQALGRKYRAMAAEARTEDELFQVMSSLIAPLHDLHVSLEGGDRFFDPGFTPFLDELWAGFAAHKDQEPDLERYLLAASREYVAPVMARYMDANSVQPLNPNLLIATLQDGSIGYLQVLSEGSYLPRGTHPYRLRDEIAAAAAAFDEAFSKLSKVRALIVDMRVNFGGEDAVSLELAGRLTERDQRGFVKCGRVGDGWTDAQPTSVRAHLPGYHGPVVLLISLHTISAGDEFLMLVKDYPNVVTVGETSAGAYSDPLHWTLPNGWRVGISNERYLAPDGQAYEAIGIPPDIRVPVFLESMHRTGVDPALEKALDVISTSPTHLRDAFPHPRLATGGSPRCGASGGRRRTPGSR
jgi:carboxyl-terminal processing protease